MFLAVRAAAPRNLIFSTSSIDGAPTAGLAVEADFAAGALTGFAAGADFAAGAEAGAEGTGADGAACLAGEFAGAAPLLEAWPLLLAKNDTQLGSTDDGSDW